MPWSGIALAVEELPWSTDRIVVALHGSNFGNRSLGNRAIALFCVISKRHLLTQDH